VIIKAVMVMKGLTISKWSGSTWNAVTQTTIYREIYSVHNPCI